MSMISIPDKTSQTGRGLGVAWGPGNCLALHTKPTKEEEQGCKGGLGGVVQVHEVRWETTLYEPVYRKLVNESLGVFLSLQKLEEEEGARPGVEQLVRVSRQYRSVIKDCQEQLEQLAETGAASQSGHYLAQSELLYKLELIWHLVEILYIGTTPGGLVLPSLLHWVSLHFTGCEERARLASDWYLIYLFAMSKFKLFIRSVRRKAKLSKLLPLILKNKHETKS